MTDEAIATLIYEAIDEVTSSGWLSEFRIGEADFDGEPLEVGIDTRIDMLALARVLRAKLGI